jgi:hypothetical protein
MSDVLQNTDNTIYKGDKDLSYRHEAKFEFPLYTLSFFSLNVTVNEQI